MDIKGETLEIAKKCSAKYYNLTECTEIMSIISNIPYVDHDMLMEMSLKSFS